MFYLEKFQSFWQKQVGVFDTQYNIHSEIGQKLEPRASPSQVGAQVFHLVSYSFALTLLA